MLYHDLQSLRIFLAACEMRSMSKAAESLNIALSAASRRLSLLERELGTPLIVRRPHGIEPTAAGLTMMNYAREVLRLGDRLKVSLDEHRSGVRGYVRVSASSSVLVQRLAKDLSQFVRENPQIKVDLEERPSAATVLAIALPNDHRLAKRRELRFADILDEDIVALESGTATNKLLTSRAIELGKPMKVRVQVRSFEVMCLMINQGLGVGILPELGARPLSKALGIKLVRLAEPWAQRRYAICVRALENIEAPSSRLIAFLTANAENEPGGSKPVAKPKLRRR